MFTPQITGDPFAPGAEMEKLSVVQAPTASTENEKCFDDKSVSKSVTHFFKKMSKIETLIG